MHGDDNVRVIPLADLQCYRTRDLDNTFNLFSNRFPDGVNVTLGAITSCFDEFSPLDQLCFFLDRDQRRRVIGAQLRDYTKSSWLIDSLRELRLNSTADSLLAQKVENLDEAAQAVQILEHARKAADDRADELFRENRGPSPQWRTAGDVELQLRLILGHLEKFVDPQGWDVVLHGNSFDENTARYIVEELNGRAVL